MNPIIRRVESDLLEEDVEYSHFDLRSIADSMEIREIQSVSFRTQYEYEYSSFKCYEKRLETEKECKDRLWVEQSKQNNLEVQLRDLAKKLGYNLTKNCDVQ